MSELHTEELPMSTTRRLRAEEDASGPAIVAFGGGHGLYAALRAFRLVTDRLTAVVTVADDGGSSGRLRDEIGGLPPGDLRMALAALCDDGEWGSTWRDVIQHRFSSTGPLDGHSTGNLLIATLWQLLGDPVDGLDWMARLLRAHGRVLPMSSVPLTIEADVRDRETGETATVRGQSDVAVTTGTVETIRLDPPDPPARRETLESVLQADVINLGPGSWYTSVMPHLLVPELADAICRSTALKLLTLNLTAASGETRDLSMCDHLEALHLHAPELRFNYVLADTAVAAQEPGLQKAAAELFGATLVTSHVAETNGKEHDQRQLADTYRDILAREGLVKD